MKIPLVGESYTARSLTFDAQRTVNMFPEFSTSGSSKEVSCLIGTPGLTSFCVLPSTGCRGVYEAQGRAFCVYGTTLYELTSTGTFITYGSIQGADPVGMVDDGVNLVITCGPFGYYFTLASNTLTAYPSTSVFSGCTAPEYLDSYIAFNQPNSPTWYLSDPGNATSFVGVFFAARNGGQDNLCRLVATNRLMMLLGTQTSEFWTDTGNSGFPFQFISGAFIEVGCMAPFSVAKLPQQVFWLAQDRRGFGEVWMSQGPQAQRISTHPIEEALRGYGYANLQNATAYTYQQDGHSFYCLNVPTANTTWCYDTVTSLWHERVWLNTVTGQEERHRGQFAAHVFGKILVGDYATGDVYFYDTSNYTDNGNVIERVRTFPHIDDDLRRLFFDSLFVDMQTGIGLPTGQGQNPTLMLSYSNDGGYTWSSEITTTAGMIGQYRARAMWRRLGMTRDRVFKLRITDPVPICLVAGSINVREGLQ